jgi:hypothetical protein
MMGHGHTSFNLVNGLALGDALALPPLVTLTMGVCLAGAGTLPDIDCHGSTASTAFGPFSDAVHHASKHLHHMVAASLYSEHDFENGHSEHRGLTHWWPFWIVCGGGVEIGCLTVGRWFVMGVIAILFALAARGLSIPDVPTERQDRFLDSLKHEFAMRWAYRLLLLCPFTWCMRLLNKRVRRTRRYTLFSIFSHDFGFRFGIGKVVTLGVSVLISYALVTQGVASTIGPWLGLIVFAGMLLHWLGDSPTHMGVPGFLLHHKWKLPFWASFYAGGPFEVAVIWFCLGWLNLLLIPGLAPRWLEMDVITWGGLFLGLIILLAIIVEGTQRTKQRRYAT